MTKTDAPLSRVRRVNCVWLGDFSSSGQTPCKWFSAHLLNALLARRHSGLETGRQTNWAVKLSPVLQCRKTFITFHKVSLQPWITGLIAGLTGDRDLDEQEDTSANYRNWSGITAWWWFSQNAQLWLIKEVIPVNYKALPGPVCLQVWLENQAQREHVTIETPFLISVSLHVSIRLIQPIDRHYSKGTVHCKLSHQLLPSRADGEQHGWKCGS